VIDPFWLIIIRCRDHNEAAQTVATTTKVKHRTLWNFRMPAPIKLKFQTIAVPTLFSPQQLDNAVAASAPWTRVIQRSQTFLRKDNSSQKLSSLFD
jgi:hypothetical protein